MNRAWKPIFCHDDCKFEFRWVVEHCPRCSRFVGDVLRRMVSYDNHQQDLEDYRNGVNQPERSFYHKGPTRYGM